MTIKTSAASQIDALVVDLSSGRAAVRDAAIARLAVIGSRAVAKLAALARETGTASVARVPALRALEGLADARAIDAGLALIDDHDPDVAVAAVGVARAGIGGRRGMTIIDRLAAVALDAGRLPRVRQAALLALSDLELTTLGPLFDALSTDNQAEIRELARRLAHGERREPDDSAARIAAAARGGLPDDPETLKRAVSQAGATVPLPELRQVIDAVREREAAMPASKRQGWLEVRAAAHAALARRRSRLAVFDLRETLESGSSGLPVELMAALEAVGDGSCLEAIAVAWERAQAQGGRDAWWQRHLVDAFQVIVAREGLTARHAVMKRIEKRRPSAFAALRARPTRQ